MTFTTGFVGLDHETGEDSDNKRGYTVQDV